MRVILAVLLLFGAAPLAFSAAPRIHAGNVLVMESESGRVLFEKNANEVHPIASLTKLMIAMVVLDAKLDPYEPIEILEDDVSRIKITRSRLPLGEVVSRVDLLRLALMASDNRAAAALARTYPGGTGSAVAAMNRKARSLGLLQTRYEEPTGLSHRNVSTAAELAVIVQTARRYPEIREFSTLPEYSITTSRGVISFINTNGLTRRPGWDIDVSKTGYITEAGRCLVLLPGSGGRPVTMGCSMRLAAIARSAMRIAFASGSTRSTRRRRSSSRRASAR